MLADDIQFSSVGAADAFPISNHYLAFYGDQIVHTHFIACHMTGGS